MNVTQLSTTLFLTFGLLSKIGLAQEVLSDTLKADVKLNAYFSTGAAQPLGKEYIPNDDSPELISDRLTCLQATIPLPYNDKVHAFINYFTVRDRDYTRMIIRRQQLYFPLFEKHLAAYNLPTELKYLSVIESGLNPRAKSGAQAVGLWQFMSGTGKYFNLNNDMYEDERMDPEKSTIAACKYLSQLYTIFHDWHLALAAYNSGPGTVSRAIKRSGNKRSFWEVYNFLPAETRSYVPQYIAIIYTLNHAEEHNIFEPYREETPPSDTLAINTYFHFETFANLTGTCIEEMQKLNPSFHKSLTPDGRLAILRVPLHAKKNLALNRFPILDSAYKVGKIEAENLLKTLVGSTFGKEQVNYRVKSGEALSTIAGKFAVSIDDLKRWNKLSGNVIHPGRKLSIWLTKGNYNTATASSKIQNLIDKEGKTYTVQPGDTLWGISKKFNGLTLEKIKSLNKIRSGKIQPGQKLIVG